MVLVDSFGRRLNGLRMALTARCNLACIYCHHEGELASEREISSEMAISVANAAARLGVRSLKLTGGEPLLRRDLEDIIAGMPKAIKISLTTNGTLLEERASGLAEAGLERVNISLDSLRQKTYRAITGGREGDLEKVVRGIDSALEAGLDPVKLNVVVLRENQEEVPELIRFSREKGLILQLIELMDIRGLGISGEIGKIEEGLAARAERVATRELHRRRKYFLDGAEVEVVRPMDNTEFCLNCTRLRVTSDGRIKTCLLRNDNLIEIDTCDLGSIEKLLLRANQQRAPYFISRGGQGEEVEERPVLNSAQYDR
jgi:cyclic pyranopterin phosphate synthase